MFVLSCLFLLESVEVHCVEFFPLVKPQYVVTWIRKSDKVVASKRVSFQSWVNCPFKDAFVFQSLRTRQGAATLFFSSLNANMASANCCLQHRKSRQLRIACLDEYMLYIKAWRRRHLQQMLVNAFSFFLTDRKYMSQHLYLHR